jgi:DNA-directed RNA polymerase specialized sigma24 family protein
MNGGIEEWFAQEVLVHEAALTRYLRRAWGDEAYVPDLRQEVYIRVLEAAERARPTSPKRFMFTVARNLLTDRARRNRIRTCALPRSPTHRVSAVATISWAIESLMAKLKLERDMTRREILGLKYQRHLAR